MPAPGEAMPIESAASLPGMHDEFGLARRLKSALWVFDIDHRRVVMANEPACKLWQAASEAELCARDFSDDMSSSVAKRLKQYQLDFLSRSATFTEMWTLYPNGEPENTMVTFSGFPLSDGRMAMLCEVLGTAEDEPDNLRSAEALLHTDVMITLYDHEGATLYMNPAARSFAILGYEDLSQKFVRRKDHRRMMEGLLRSTEHKMIAEVRTPDGERWFDITAKKCQDAVTGRPAILETATDITELKMARDKAKFLADRDQLTGCFNRTYLQHHISVLSKFETRECALLYLDIDFFKQINDRHGHETGDVVLQHVASRISSAVRSDDFVVRLGGDEFLVVFKNTTDLERLKVRIDKIQQLISKPIVHDGGRFVVRSSMGVAMFRPKDADFAHVMRDADIALYVSKQHGRNRVTFYTDQMGKDADTRSQLEVDIAQALKDRQFELHFQPRYCLNEGRVVSAEALVRWRHPERGLILPGEFIPLCEETGLINELGLMVLEMSCQRAMAWHADGAGMGVSINISARQFEDTRFFEALAEYAAMPDFATGQIELELTESLLVGDNPDIVRQISEISEMGYSIAIDDFGTGFSNLSYITRFPISCIKIDRSFVNQLPESGPIVRLILTLARQIGAKVVAEGVETVEQFEFLSKEGCEQVQGYYIAAPLFPVEFEETVHRLRLNDAWSNGHGKLAAIC